MPPKSRIEEKVFQNAIRSLRIDELILLQSSKLTADIWSRLCVQMGKADNVENRRACYDAWRQNRYNSHDIVNSILQEATQSNMSTSTDHMITTSNEHIKQISVGKDTTMKQNDQFMERLRSFLSEQNQNISLIYNHDCNSTSCSGDIVSIHAICKCTQSSFNMHDPEKNSSDLFLSTDINEQDFHVDKISSNTLCDSQSQSITKNQDNSQNEDIPVSDTNTDNANIDIIATSPIYDPLHLLMSPMSSSSSVISSKSKDIKSPEVKASKLGVVPRVLERAKNILSPKKIPDHEILTDDQKNVLVCLSRQTGDTSTFTRNIDEIQRIERAKAIVVSQDDMEKLNKFRKDELEKKNNKNKKNETTPSNDVTDTDARKRNLDWTSILQKYIRQSNDYCVFMFERHYFTTRTMIGNTSKLFMTTKAYCTFDTCTCRINVTLSENGKFKVDYSGAIVHKAGETHSRPVRHSQREELQKYTSLGSTPGALWLHQLSSMSPANKEAGNRNVAGSSPSVIRKIASEANVKLRRDKELDNSLRQIKTEQENKIFPGEQIPGFLQEISTDPLRLICFTAGGIAVYNQFASSMPLSWDATGGIVINHNKKIYYYELTMSNPSKGGPSFPITVMVSDSHGTTDIVHWMNCFIAKYKQVYGFSNPFPKPPIIHSDRALVFLLAGIQVFNNDETMDRYIERCWRIVNRIATNRDLELTVVHACLGHFMKNVKKNASKDLGKKQAPFGMWLMALLVNSNTLDEMIIVWRNICIVLRSPDRNDSFKMSLSTLAKLAEEMNGDPDKTNFILKNVSVTSQGHVTSKLDIDNDDDTTIDVGLGEEEAILHMKSSFKELFMGIYQESKEVLKAYDAPTLESSIPNPLFSPKYLDRLLKLYMSTAPIWSNLLLGNFAHRYNYSLDAVNISCACHFGRTTGTSESKMRVLKEAVLNKKVYSRIDEVITKMGETIEAVEIQFADYQLIKKHKGRMLPVKKQKAAEEKWNKRKQTKKNTGVYTSQKPPKNLVAMMNTRLLGQNDDSRLDAGQPMHILQFANKERNSWFNSVLQMILASGQIGETIRQFGLISADIEVSDNIGVTGVILYSLAKKTVHSNANLTVVDEEFIRREIGHLRWAGIKIHSRESDCVKKFFMSAIIPTLLFYNIDLKFFINNLMECSSCSELSIVTRQPYCFLVVQQTGVQDSSLDNVIADLFGRSLQKKVCPKCSDEGPHYASLSLANCPKHLFVHCLPTAALDQKLFQLTPHVDISKIISNNVTFTRSYSRYTLQSFITFYGKDENRHYFTYVRHKGDWYRADDMNVKAVTSSAIFQDQTECHPIVLAHYIRPSETDVFSIALFNVFTNFSQQKPTLLPTLSLNDAANYFAQNNILNHNLLNLVVVKHLNCSICKRETYTVERMHEVWQMKSTTQHINAEIAKFVHEEVKCSSCQTSGLTHFALYDIPRFLLLNTRSNDTDCVNLIDDVDSLSIQPSLTHSSFEYSVQTVLIVLEEDDIIYLRKNGNEYLSYNKISGQFEALRDLTAQQTGLASSWIIFVYETQDVVFNPPRLEKILLDQKNLQSALEPEVWSIGTVQGLLPSFTRPFKVGPVQIEQNSVDRLLEKDGDLNDLIINGHLFLTASTAPSNNRVLALDSLIVSEILEKRLKRIDNTWLDYDMILCPIHQNKHWYIIVVDLQRKLIVELDSLPTHNIPRSQNINHLLHILNMQSLLRGQTEIKFQENWKLAIPTEDKKLQQTDIHSCGVHLLVQACAYVNNHKFVHIPADKVRLYRFQIAEDLLRKGELVSDDSCSSLPDIMLPTRKKNQRKKQKHTTA